MNEETPQNKIRSLSKEQLLDCMKGEKYPKRMILKLGIPYHLNYSKILIKAFHDNGIDTSHFPSQRKDNLEGQTFGHLEVLRQGETSKGGNVTWICKEKETGIEKPVLAKHLKSGATKSFSFFFKRGEDHVQWGGFGKISKTRWNSITRHAEMRKLEFSIDIKFAWNLYLKQNRKCALSGKDIFFGESNTCPYTASLDRIDNKKGYTEDNVQWVHTKINIMKNKFKQDEFIDFCKCVAENSEK